jgi:hypothetical protein
MSDALSFVEIEGQRTELLPARTVLSLFNPADTAVANYCEDYSVVPSGSLSSLLSSQTFISRTCMPLTVTSSH